MNTPRAGYMITVTANPLFPNGAYAVWSVLAYTGTLEDAQAIIEADCIRASVIKQRVEETELSVIKGGVKDD